MPSHSGIAFRGWTRRKAASLPDDSIKLAASCSGLKGVKNGKTGMAIAYKWPRLAAYGQHCKFVMAQEKYC